MREWISDKDERWVMRCDTQRPNGSRCTTESEPSPDQPSLHALADQGWYIAELSGDMCPACRAKGYVPTSKPHRLMGV